ncbi:hypothetical protein F5876DRAFT_73791 [Lentinula aff. lateritia]|uniref:Uncharacterized protein n=1 Tax=Lentinula aff. lateritia TaxID=2804960 RepID=A0ACC1U9P9_9AGAR|nr:hypothetical protein F5876DRAFT_73791 [Lentinula aff. lateritia]
MSISSKNMHHTHYDPEYPVDFAIEGKGSSGITRYLRVALCLLLATLVGVCIASPIPSGGETDDAGTNHSSDIFGTAYGSFNPSQIPHLNHWIDRRSLKDKLKSKLPWGKKVEEEDEGKKPVDEGEVVVLGYTYHQQVEDENHHLAYPKLHPSSKKSTGVGKKALQRLEAIVSTLNAYQYTYFFPGPNYYNDFVGRGYLQGKTKVSMSLFEDHSFVRRLYTSLLTTVFIPSTTALDETSLKKAAERSWKKRVKTGKDGKVEIEERNGKPNFANTILVVELVADDRYAMLIPHAILDSISGGLDPKVNSHDMPAVTWQSWDKFREVEHMPKTFVYTE